ncbi:MAG: uncharacterized protein JWN67_3016 [Actinomycetia bacterium]|nr:uncharacterized protein [Actinomycetes bacterium]
MRMRRSLVAALVFAGALVGFASPAHACSCVGFTDEEAFARADTVFVGTPVEKQARDREDGSYASTDPARWVFQVDRVYKGRVGSPQGVVSARDGASCGLELALGVRALVFVRDGRADLCNGTRESAVRPVPASFGSPRGPTDRAVGVPADGRPWWPFAAGGAVTVGAAVLVRRARIAACRPSGLPRSSPS